VLLLQAELAKAVKLLENHLVAGLLTKPVAADCRFDPTKTMSLVKAWVSGEQQLQAEAEKLWLPMQENFLGF
jgi:hypothetical protein